jgi:cell wall-associated NlpC family hydrolase
MSDRSTGWVPTRYLRFTGSEVDISAQLAARSAALSNPNYNRFTGDSSGNYSSNVPAVSYALGWLGTPYRYGGTSRRGIDCSSLVQQAFGAAGRRLPRTAAQQATVGQPVDPSNLQAGDRLYFSASGTRIDHTGLYIGNGQFVHASGRGRGVIVSNLADPHQWNIFVGARR